MKPIQATRIRETAWALCGIADTLERNMLAKDLSDSLGPPLPENVEAHLITAFKVLAYLLNGDTEDIDTYEFVRRADHG